MIGLKPDGWLFPLMVLVFAYLMVSTVRYPDFKGKDGEPVRTIPAVIAVAIGAYILFLTFNAVLFVPFFVFAIFGILNTVFGMFARQ